MKRSRWVVVRYLNGLHRPMWVVQLRKPMYGDLLGPPSHPVPFAKRSEADAEKKRLNRKRPARNEIHPFAYHVWTPQEIQRAFSGCLSPAHNVYSIAARAWILATLNAQFSKASGTHAAAGVNIENAASYDIQAEDEDSAIEQAIEQARSDASVRDAYVTSAPEDEDESGE